MIKKMSLEKKIFCINQNGQTEMERERHRDRKPDSHAVDDQGKFTARKKKSFASMRTDRQKCKETDMSRCKLPLKKIFSSKMSI